MASKLFVALLASSLAFLLVADATFIRTTVSEIEEDNRRSTQGSCSHQLREMDLSPCMDWMRMRHSGGQGRRRMEPSSTEYMKEQCCDMMSQMQGQECRCQALKEMLNRECSSGRFSIRGQEQCGSEMIRDVMKVPHMCNNRFKSCDYSMVVVEVPLAKLRPSSNKAHC